MTRQGNGIVRQSPGLALHRQVFLALRDQVLQGIYPPGAVLPNEEELCAMFGVSRITLRRAVGDLEAQGLLQRRHGRGTFVNATLPGTRPDATLGLVDSLRRAATETSAEVLRIERTPPPVSIARQLGLAPSAKAVHAVRLRRQGETPVAVTEAWVPLSFGRHITAKRLRKQALYEILAAEGVEFGRVVQEITASAATPYYARLLDVEIGSPLLRLARLLYHLDGEPVEHITVHISSERSRILMDVSVDAVDTLAAGSIFHDLG